MDEKIHLATEKNFVHQHSLKIKRGVLISSGGRGGAGVVGKKSKN